MGWPLGLNASSSSLPLPQVGDGFTPAIPTNSKPANATPTDQTDFKQQRPELLGQILEMQRFMSNLAIEQPDHWLNWGIAQLQKKKTSTQLLEKGALSLDELAEKLAVGKISVSEARKQFRQILKENNLDFEKAVEAEAGVFENLAFGAETVDKLSDQGVQEILEYKFGPEVAFLGSGSYRVLKLILREYLTVKNESDCPADDKAILQKAFERIMQNGTWKPAFQATAQDYLQRKFSRSMPKEVGQVLQSGVLYFGTDLMSQIMRNLLYEKPPFENLDAKSLGLSFVVGLAGGLLGKQLDKTNLSDIHKLLIEAGYDGTSAVLQEIILQISNGVSLKEIFSEKSMKDLFQQLILESTGGRWTMRTNSIKNNQENSITEQNNINTEEPTQVKTTDNRQEIQRVLVYQRANLNRLKDYISQVQDLIQIYEEQGKKISIKEAVDTVLSVEQVQKDIDSDLSEVVKIKPTEAKEAQSELYKMMVQKLEQQIISLKNTIKNTQDIKEKAKLEKQLNLIENNLARMQEVQGIKRSELVVASLDENTLASVDENKQNTIKPEIVFLNEYNDWKIQTREDGNPDLKLVNLLKGQPTERFVRPFSTLEYIKELSNGHKISIWLPANISDWGTISIKGKDGKAQTQRPSEETIKELSKKLLEQIDNSLANIPDSEKCFLKVLAISPFPVNLQRYRGGRICADRTLVENSNIKTNAVVKFFVGSELSLAEGISNNHYLKYWIMPNLIHEIGHIRDYANGNPQNIKNVIKPNDVYKSDSSFEDFRIRRTEYLNYTKQHYIINALRVDMRYRQTIKEGTLLSVRSIMETAIRGSKSLKSQDEIDNFLLSWKKQIVAIIPRNTLSNHSRLAYEQKFEKLRGILDNTRLGKTPEDKALEMSQELINELWEEVDFLRITNYGSTQPGEAIAEAYNYYWRAKSASKNGDNKSLHWLQTLYPVTFNLFEEEFNNTNKTQDLQSPAQSEKVNSINNTPQNLSNNPEAGYFILSGLKPKVPPLMEAVLKLPVLGKNPKSEYFPNFPTFKNWLGLSSKQVSNNNNTPKTQTENTTEITQNNTQEETVSNAQTQEEPQINSNNSQIIQLPNSSGDTQNTPKIAKPNIGSGDFILSLEKQNPQKAKYLEYILNKHPELKESLNNTEVQKNLDEVELHEGTTSDDITYNLKLIQSILPTALEIKLNETLEKELVREVNNINQQDIKEIKNFLQLIKINNPATYDVLLFVLNNNKAIIYKLTETEVQKNLDELELSSSNEDEVLLQNLNSIKEILGLEINNINTPKNSNWIELEDTWNFTDELLIQTWGLENTDLDPVIRKIQLNYKNLPETVQKKLNNPDRSEVTTELIAQALREKTINPNITVHTLEELIDEANKLESNIKKAETIREFGGLIKYLNNPNIQIARLKDSTIEEFVNSLERLKFNIDHPIQIPNSDFFMGFDNVVDLNELKQLLGFISTRELETSCRGFLSKQLQEFGELSKHTMLYTDLHKVIWSISHLKQKLFSLMNNENEEYSNILKILNEKGLLEKFIYSLALDKFHYNQDLKVVLEAWNSGVNINLVYEIIKEEEQENGTLVLFDPTDFPFSPRMRNFNQLLKENLLHNTKISDVLTNISTVKNKLISLEDTHSNEIKILNEKGLLEKFIYTMAMSGFYCSSAIKAILYSPIRVLNEGENLNLLYETINEILKKDEKDINYYNKLLRVVDINFDTVYIPANDFSFEKIKILKDLNRELINLNYKIEMAIEDLGKIQSEEKFENAFSKKNTELRGKFNTLIEKYTHTLRELRSKENAKVITLTPNHKIIYDRYRDYTYDRANYAGLTTEEKLTAQQLDYEVMARLDMIIRQQIPEKFSDAYSQIRRYSTNVSNASSSDSLWFNFDKLPKLDKKVIIDCIKTARAIMFDNLSTEEKIERQSEFQDEIKEEVDLLYWADENKNLNNFLPILLDVFYYRIISKNDKEYNKQKFIPVDRTEEVTKFRATIENRVRENGKMVDFAINFMYEKYNQLAQFNPPTDGQHKLLIAVDNFLKKVDTNRIHDRYDIDNVENYTNIDFSEFNEHIYDNEFTNNAKKLFIEIKNLLGIDLENTYSNPPNK